MKCNLHNKTLEQLSPGEKKKLYTALDEYNAQYLKQERDRLGIVITDNLLKLIVIAANEEAKLGRQRLTRIIKKTQSLIYHSKEDEIFFEHVDRRVKQIIGEDLFKEFFVNTEIEID